MVNVVTLNLQAAAGAYEKKRQGICMHVVVQITN